MSRQDFAHRKPSNFETDFTDAHLFTMEVDVLAQESSMPKYRSSNKRLAEFQVPREQKRRKAATTSQRNYQTVGDVDLESDAESQSSVNSSFISEQAGSAPTPSTPQSPAGSHKYPSDQKTLQCPRPDCEKTFNRPARLKDHLRSHTNDRVFKCPHQGCDKDFLRDSHLNHHIKSAHTEIRDYVCDWEGCGKAFVTATRLRRHAAVHEGQEKYRCSGYPPCDESFRKHATLQRHITSAHLHQKPYPCTISDPGTGEQCSEGFDTAGKLRAHEGRTHGGTRFSCAECPDFNDEDAKAASYPTYTDLQNHILKVHPPTCLHCSNTYSSPRELRRHVELVHGELGLSERKTHSCSYPDCGRAFTKKGNLNVHVRTVHEGEKRFICGETDLRKSKKVVGWTGEGACGSEFGVKLSLEEHVRTAHMGLANSKLKEKPRKERRNREKKSHDSSLVASLTGTAYLESGRHISCLAEDCAYMFHRDYDLGLHLKAMHGMSEMELRGLFGSADSELFNREGILWIDYDMGVEGDDEGDNFAQEELDRRYEELMQLDGEDEMDGQVMLTQADMQPLEDRCDAVLDPVLRYLQI